MVLNETQPSSHEQPEASDNTRVTANNDQAPATAAQEDKLDIPESIKEQRRRNSVVVRARTTKTHASVEQNGVVLDRTGYIKQQQDGLVFIYDGMGQNRQTKQFRLLPCALLESMEDQQAQSPDTLYFRVAGTRTLYKGQSFLLLRRATRSYSHGNFKR